MSFVISYKRGDSRPLVISDYDSDEAEAREWCQNLISDGMDRVALHSLNLSGDITVVQVFEKHKQTRKAKVKADPEPIAEEAIEDETPDDETQTYNGYCVKCREKRDFSGIVETSSKGRRMAKGTCPVCHTKMNRMLANLAPEDQESYDTPDDEPEAVLFSDTEVESTTTVTES